MPAAQLSLLADMNTQAEWNISLNLGLDYAQNMVILVTY
jgi:hypothetical protein